MTTVQENLLQAIRGPPSLLRPYRAVIGFFDDPIGYLNNLFAEYGKLVWLKPPAMVTPPTPDYLGTVVRPAVPARCWWCPWQYPKNGDAS